MKTLRKKELKEILIKNWMTHDAMWFYHCLQECGIERTNKINKAAVRAMGKIEIKRIQKAAGIDKVETSEDLKLLIEVAWGTIKGDFMKQTYSFPSENVLRGEMKSCFAYEGIKRIGAIDHYQCGIFDRIEGWLDSLGIKYSVTPQVAGCMMHTEGRCFRDYRFYF
ncbi:MAG: hypothetical protein FJ006_05275 [Chloroflexi bacterium]|nr:hypothetical protein [Chloroflexota bacterium]